VRLLLSGYYGFDNFGDEAILGIFVDEWRRRRPADTLRVLSQTPAQTARLGVEAIQRTAVAQIAQAMRETDVFISGGGGLLQTSTSLRSLLYYTGLIHEAKSAGAKAVIFGQGIGPLSFTGRLIVGRTCANVDLAIVRDDSSLELLRQLVPKVDARLAADLVFLAPAPLSGEAAGEVGERMLALEGIPSAGEIVAVVVRQSRMLERIAGDIATMVDELATRHRAQVIFVPFQRPADVEAAVSIIRRCKSAPVLIGGGYDLETMSRLFARCAAVIGMRLHSLILAARLGVPFVAVSYDPKIVALVDNLRYPLAPLEPGSGRERAATLWETRAALAAHLRAVAPEQSAHAIQAFDWLQSFVEGALR
jgi:polysaccharide pyruvyl transferase CsaB